MQNPDLSIVIPVFNESIGLRDFNKSLHNVLKNLSDKTYEIIYCDDGSTDDTHNVIKELSKNSPHTKLIRLTRNFGKEIATTAGIHNAAGQAIITLDADGQHPVDLIPEFVKRWRAGSKLVVGLRLFNQKEGLVKRFGSKLFYKSFNLITHVKLVPGATDYRLIDRAIQREFMRMTEHNRISRGLIDWLGYKPDFIEFKANPRQTGEASYSFKKLFKLAIDSTISLSLSPLYISAYIGGVVLPLSTLLGLAMIINALFGDPLSLHATGSAYLTVFMLFLVGILLVSQGIIGLYLSHIHTETQNRPLYIIDYRESVGVRQNQSA